MTDKNHEADAPAEVELDRKQIIKMLVEFGPLFVFFVTNWQAGKFLTEPKDAIFYGTGAFMAATLLALLTSRAILGRIPTMPLVSGFFVIVFGGLTLWLKNDEFIKLKPTIVNALFAAILFGGLANGQTLLKIAFGDVFKLTEDGWRKLTIRWGCFFVFLALLNEIVWRSFSTDFWVSFKVFGIMPITMIFALAQLGLLRRHELR